MALEGAMILDIEPQADERGFFARSFCAEEMEARGLCSRFAQGGISFNRAAGTLRGMHWQAAPHGETKIVRCTRGRIHDVVVDLREGSPTRFRWEAVEMDAASARALYVPEGFAHGFLTLEPLSEVHYMISAPHSPAHQRGARWDDPDFGIEWPAAPGPLVVSDRDRAHPPVSSWA
jgi:dTDP-4-dehydrorhamnose 3,5-epimerase